MTLNKYLLIISACVFSVSGCKQTESAPSDLSVAEGKTAINPKNLQKATFTIEGMTCAIGCAKTIEKKLSETKGVANAVVDFDKKEATVSFDSLLQTPESLTKIVEATADGETYKVSHMVCSK